MTNERLEALADASTLRSADKLPSQYGYIRQEIHTLLNSAKEA